MSEPVAWISVLSFQTVVVRILHFSGLVYRPTLPAYTGRAVVVCCILDQETAIRSQVVSKIADLKVKKTYETQIRHIVKHKKPVVHDTQSLKYRCQSVSITAENDCVLAASTLSQVPVPVPVVQVPVQVQVLGMQVQVFGMQVQVQVPVPENCT